jgi:hypothetical protein
MTPKTQTLDREGDDKKKLKVPGLQGKVCK